MKIQVNIIQVIVVVVIKEKLRVIENIVEQVVIII